eukprot:m.337215 g.337215  ORF g.337215 m.337215 type:complete len:348 (+) comp18077_c0_seq1:91-1134(+)
MASCDLSKPVLVTGGAGYIGSHTLVEMIEDGIIPVVLDNYVNSNPEAVRRVEEITGKKIEIIEMDLMDEQKVMDLFKSREFSAVIHFAGLKAVGESTRLPLLYYHNNVTGTLHLLKAMKETGCSNLVFSSSATVYGDAKELPINEDTPVGINLTNPYGKTKYFIEEICRDFAASCPDWNIIILRYFNPIGSHPSGKIGEDPNGVPNNLVPYVAQVAVGRREFLSVFGHDYDTPDGTGVRDYIHVCDLAAGHVAALRRIAKNPCGCVAYNLGTGDGKSVLQVVAAYEKASGKKIATKLIDRRPGDVAANWADPAKAAKELNFKTKRTLEEMCADSWRWQSNNPNGYKE